MQIFQLFLLIVVCLIDVANFKLLNVFDLRYWRCLLRRTNKCPISEIKIYLYSKTDGFNGTVLKKRLDVRNPDSLQLCGWQSNRKNAIIIHGFNGSENKHPMSFLRDAYLTTEEYNVFTVDWKPLTNFPCYLSSLQNSRLVAQCVAQFYSYLTKHGALANNTVCIGHSLGAHVCGMMTSHLSAKQGRIIGLDPARPLINRFARKEFKLSKDDAHNVQIIHSNAGFLGETNLIGHVDFCVNGGQTQPGCHGHRLSMRRSPHPKRIDFRQSRCSHFQAVCYLAFTVKTGRKIYGYPCSNKCPRKRKSSDRLPGRPIPFGEACPIESRGMFCVNFSHNKNCRFD